MLGTWGLWGYEEDKGNEGIWRRKHRRLWAGTHNEKFMSNPLKSGFKVISTKIWYDIPIKF